MPFRWAAIIVVALCQLFAATDLAEAQRQKGKIGGGGGFAFLTDPDVDLGRTASVGGFFGLRFNDNLSLEGGLYFVRSNRVFSEFGIPVDETPDTPALRFETTRFHADGVLVLNIGRRQPFHPFVLFGATTKRPTSRSNPIPQPACPCSSIPKSPSTRPYTYRQASSEAAPRFISCTTSLHAPNFDCGSRRTGASALKFFFSPRPTTFSVRAFPSKSARSSDRPSN